MKFREFTLSAATGTYHEQRTIDVNNSIELLDRHTATVGGLRVAPIGARVFHKPRFQIAVQGVNETAPTVYVETE